MATVNPYLNFQGNTEEALNFYRAAFGTEFITLMRFKDTPHGAQMSADDQEKIMHAAIPIGTNSILMATDMLESMGQKLTIGNFSTLSVHPASLDEAHALFNALSTGGTVHNPLEKAFWGAYWGMFHDKFGVPWMVNYDPNHVQ